MKAILVLLFTVMCSIAAQRGGVDLYTAKDIQVMGEKLAQKHTQFAAQDLAKYGTHYTMLAERAQTGSSEVHEHEADIFIIESGEGSIVTGGKLVNPRSQKAGEIRGSSIEGGERHRLGAGDIIHLPAGTPHQLLVEKGKPFTYFVIKVKDE